MKYPRSEKYALPFVTERIMGPNPLKLQEELLLSTLLPAGATVMDLGSGQGVTSAFLAKEYGLRVFAADLWSDPTDNMRFFSKMGLTSREIVPVKADANALPFAHDFFDAVISTDSYNYFGRDPAFLDEKLLPFVAPGGLILIVVPGMKKDLHGNLPPEILLSWNEEQMDYLHDADYWMNMVSKAQNAEVLSVSQMESNEEVWNDWIQCDNDYARGDKKAIDAGACRYLNFVAIKLRRRMK